MISKNHLSGQGGRGSETEAYNSFIREEMLAHFQKSPKGIVMDGQAIEGFGDGSTQQLKELHVVDPKALTSVRSKVANRSNANLSIT